MVDAIGDLFVAGGAMMGTFAVIRSVHGLSNALWHALFSDDNAWCYDELRGDAVNVAIDGGIFAESMDAVSAA